jgi:hypothetical protein
MQMNDMDKKLERSNADKVLRRLTNHIKTLGYVRTKPTFWVREKAHVVEFIHIHKYSFGPYFRIHTCLRPFNASLEFIALVGPTENELSQDISFEYAENIESVEQCAIKMASFIQRHSEAWYKKWSEPKALVGASSPLDEQHKEDLRRALEGNVNPTRVKLTRELLKIA